ncbi:hypothetical protein C8R44DRAFT_865699 [Mycena epipterygia]|nr:hypothetical protein C8R44DRAFT_865699 [Mycena epipterygia]
MVSINQVPLTSSALVMSTGTGTDNYFRTVVVSALLGVLKDLASSGHRHTVIEAVMSIFNTQRRDSRSDFVFFVPTISECLLWHPIMHAGYDRTVTALLNGEDLTLEPRTHAERPQRLRSSAMARGIDQRTAGLDRLDPPPRCQVYQAVAVTCAADVHGPHRDALATCKGAL